MSLNSVGTSRTNDSKISMKSDTSNWSWKNKANVKSRLGLGNIIKQHKPKLNPIKINFEFTSNKNGLELGSRKMTEIAEENDDDIDHEHEMEDLSSKGQMVTDYINRELGVIQTGIF